MIIKVCETKPYLQFKSFLPPADLEPEIARPHASANIQSANTSYPKAVGNCNMSKYKLALTLNLLFTYSQNRRSSANI